MKNRNGARSTVNYICWRLPGAKQSRGLIFGARIGHGANPRSEYYPRQKILMVIVPHTSAARPE